jgi:hypothetical protein
MGIVSGEARSSAERSHARIQPADARSSQEKQTSRHVDRSALSAKEAGLRYVSDVQPGIRRKKKSGKNVQYVDAEGKPVRNREMLQRICSQGNSTGVDGRLDLRECAAKGRKGDDGAATGQLETKEWR